ncbi:MAG TPA: 6-carboxytetrahydropterin synthase QueD [Candidatus Kapabacteria bacterium]|nr:6-carboxytetrahydropterin synthase QueD [Candidatus Kapabacteria bacterium]
MIIAKCFEFEAAHQLPDQECYGACGNLHGHTYKLIIEVEGQINEYGWVMNFKDLKSIVKTKVVDVLDHSFINDIIPLSTAENIILWIEQQIKADIEQYAKLKSIVLFETSNSYAKITY